MWKNAIVLRLITWPQICCQPKSATLSLSSLKWSKIAIYFKPRGRASLYQRTWVPHPLIYRYIKGHGIIHIHSHVLGATISLYSTVSFKFTRQGTGDWQWVILGKKLKTRQLLLHGRSYFLGWNVHLKWDKGWKAFWWNQSVIGWHSTENQLRAHNWIVMVVGGERKHGIHGSSYMGHMLYRKVPATGTRGSKLGLTGWSWINFCSSLCLCCLNY